MDYEIVERMQNSIYKNIGEIAETCVGTGITNAYDLIDVICNYGALISYMKTHNKSGVYNEILKVLGEK